jgi:hypothetical protein
MKRFAMTVGLICLLSSSVLAGEIPCGDFAPPPPLPAAPSATSPGDVPCNDFAQPTTTDELILNVLDVLSLGYLGI